MNRIRKFDGTQEQLFAKLYEAALAETRDEGEAMLAAQLAVDSIGHPGFAACLDVVLKDPEVRSMEEARTVTKLILANQRTELDKAIAAVDAVIERFREGDKTLRELHSLKAEAATARLRNHEEGIALSMERARQEGERQTEAIRLAIEDGCEPERIAAAFAL